MMNLKEQRREQQCKHRRARSLYRAQRRVEGAFAGKGSSPSTRSFVRTKRCSRRRPSTAYAKTPSDDESLPPWDPPDPIESLNLPPRRPIFDRPIPESMHCCGAWGLSTNFYSTLERLCPFAFCGATEFTAINMKLRSLIIASGEAWYNNTYWLKVCAMMCAMAQRHKEFKCLYAGCMKRSKSLRRVSNEVQGWGLHFDPLPPKVTLQMIQETLRLADGVYQGLVVFYGMFHWMANVICSYTAAIFLLEEASFFFGPSRQVLKLARGVKRVVRNLFCIDFE
eukprot:Blabericola_migrator_1__3341@NODE_1987_length_3452_cov_148_495421_g1265_i0_p2_GENE_NODE_1987_length_3452_cov_148_495421_g1265_i0NODE_1987_length_3452_cov_148_495421_g1265_i0_p2_ORF_typecomplete_len281_score41_23Baculo_p48/PF04878_13/0_043_NODE_1987_length_3452_cov_148_495421_g1265_i07291571